MILSRDTFVALNVFAGELSRRFESVYDRTDRGHSGSILWHFEVDRYFGSKSGEAEDRLAVKMLPREKNAPEPGFQLEYKTSSTVIASVGDETSVSKNIPDIKSRALL